MDFIFWFVSSKITSAHAEWAYVDHIPSGCPLTNNQTRKEIIISMVRPHNTLYIFHGHTI